MPRYEKFQDLPAWQEAARLYNAVLDLLETTPLPFTPGFRNQLDRAALSVSNNIAEGFERTTTAELLQFLNSARGSAGEVRSMTRSRTDGGAIFARECPMLFGGGPRRRMRKDARRQLGQRL